MRIAPDPRTTLALLALAFTLGACEPAPEADTTDEATGTPEATEPAGDPAAATAMDDALVNPNDADEARLRALPGLDSTAVAMIVAERPFENMVALDARLSERMDSTALDALYRRMFIPLDLNSASEEEILLIPGVGPRMAHEFEEYRPYDGGIEEFRREIGKYVDEEEVARLERYVTIR